MLGKPSANQTGSTWGLFYVPRTTRTNGIFTTDKDGYIFSEFFKILAYEKGMALPPLMLKHPDEAIDEYLKNYDLVAVLHDPEGNNICYSRKRRNRLPVEFTDRLRRTFQLMPNDTLLWSDDVSKDPQEGPAREIIYGEPPDKSSRETAKARLAKKWAHPAELSPEEMDYLTGKSDEPPTA